MTLAEKIALLRRQSGQSQEALADRLCVSRQAVSKWESGASVPELDKLLALSEVFGVSTDYLLKDDEPAPPAAPAAPAVPALRRVEAREAAAYLELVARSCRPVAWGVSFYILSPLPLLFLGVMADGTPREDLAGGVGVILLLVCVVAGLLLHLPAQLRLDAYEYLEKEEFCLAAGAEAEVWQQREQQDPAYRRAVTAGVVLCVLCAVPLLAAAGLNAPDLAVIGCVAVLLGIVVVAVQLFIRAGMPREACDRLLQIGDYTPDKKRRNRRTGWVMGVYWCVVAALYLGISLPQKRWGETWVIWPVAAVLFAALMILVEALGERGGKNKV